VGGQRHAPVPSPLGERPFTLVPESGWATGPVWTGAKNLAFRPIGIRSPDRPAVSDSLYRWRCPSPRFV